MSKAQVILSRSCFCGSRVEIPGRSTISSSPARKSSNTLEALQSFRSSTLRTLKAVVNVLQWHIALVPHPHVSKPVKQSNSYCAATLAHSHNNLIAEDAACEPKETRLAHLKKQPEGITTRAGLLAQEPLWTKFFKSDPPMINLEVSYQYACGNADRSHYFGDLAVAHPHVSKPVKQSNSYCAATLEQTAGCNHLCHSLKPVTSEQGIDAGAWMLEDSTTWQLEGPHVWRPEVEVGPKNT